MDDIIDRMNPGEGIARNRALKENVFMIFTCIMRKIPLFLCGNPGCSKTLALNLIIESMRGAKFSQDLYFQ